MFDDWELEDRASLAFQVRPVPFVIEGESHGVSASAAQAIFKEVNRLPRTSYRFADETRARLERGLREGVRVRLADEEARTVLVAVERIRIRSGRLPSDLARLRDALMRVQLTAA